MKETKYSVKIIGSSPLLMNRYVEGTVEEIKVRKGDVRKRAVEDKLYLDSDGKPYIPSAYLRGSLVEAGKNVQIAGKRKATYSKVVGSCVVIYPDAIPLKGSWKPFTITAVNPMTKGRMPVTRPKFDKWELEFEIIATDDIPREKLAIILEEAGRYVGIGDWRPQKKGMYGKFTVSKFEETK